MMRGGADVIFQACVFDGQWLGRPDFLIKVDQPSALGDWSYEVVDAKLSRSAKAGAVLQICFYSEMLEAAQGAAPEHMHLALGGMHGHGGEVDGGGPAVPLESFRFTDFAAYYRSVNRGTHRQHERVHGGSRRGRGPRFVFDVRWLHLGE